MTSDALQAWTGEHGDEYVERNAERALCSRARMWADILRNIAPRSILELGGGAGANLDALQGVTDAVLFNVEPNELARRQNTGKHAVVEGHAELIPFSDSSVDLVFTCGVLIHIDPADLVPSMQEMFRVSHRYIGCIEYFSAEPEEMSYRGQRNMLWKRDYGALWMRRFEVECLDYGFVWKPATGLDNLTWWLFEKVK